MSDLKVTIDTNVLLVSISDRSRYHLIYRAFLNGIYTLCVTGDILDEYEEIFEQPHHLGPTITQDVLEVIDNAPNVALVTKFFRWELIKNDPDDNKFVDCAVACNADFIVTNDRHFTILKGIPFPRLQVINIDEFIDILKSFHQ
ncbi:putative toxin-antitoxin system toxin component, PIN family [Larkinella sp. C7]|jgi:putative PIN family toxin of toxin-antitoxin system|uniref:putative toxin-antitoxin system toxin component, PIN family n=1 Tax=Larkinella sp. C7 TaxID=2576607 RepID=UPI0011111CD3|nr:putative toxin-antitoxin system toxin component, PIN family [Larkinella sp. C7]